MAVLDATGFKIIRATEEHAAAIQEITREAFSRYVELSGIGHVVAAQTETIEDIEKDIREKEVYIAFLDDVPVGSARVELRPDGTAYFSRFGVRIAYQSNGVGKALMNVVDLRMKHKGIKSLYLHTASRFHSLMRFYYGRGFYVTEVGTDRGYYRVTMRKDYES